MGKITLNYSKKEEYIIVGSVRESSCLTYVPIRVLMNGKPKLNVKISYSDAFGGSDIQEDITANKDYELNLTSFKNSNESLNTVLSHVDVIVKEDIASIEALDSVSKTRKHSGSVC